MRDTTETGKYLDKWLEIIASPEISQDTAKWVSEEAKNNFANYFNKSWLDYRKSVTLSGQWAGTEWTGKGAIFKDVFGNEYIDCLGGYGMMSFGWSNEYIITAVKNQLQRTPMPSQELIDPLRGVLAKAMAAITPGDLQYSFFAASGTESIEVAIKVAKLYTQKSGFIVAVNGFHGKTMGSLSMIGKSDYKDGMGKMYGGEVQHVPFGDAEAIEQRLSIAEKTGLGVAAVILEPIQGEAGAIVPPDSYWPKVREITKKYDVLLIADEVQTGLGRTGKMWGVDHYDVVPDILCTAKAFGGGVMPVSCCTSTAKIWKVLMEPNPFMHTTTTGGGPLACAAAIATIRYAIKEKIWEQAQVKGEYLLKNLNKIASDYPNIIDKITGKGLLTAMHFHSSETGYKVVANLFSRKVLVAGTLTNAKSVRVEPPLVIEIDLIDEFLNRLLESLKAVHTK